MATSYTTLLGFALPVTGELSGTWGTTVNDSITQLVEDSVAGVATNSVASGNWTLTTTGSGAANQARCAILIPTGSPGVSRNIIAPSTSKAYFVINQSNAAVVVKGLATTGVTIPAGKNACVAWNASDFVKVASNEVNDGTSGGIPYYSSSSTIASSAALAASAIVLGGGAGVAPATTTTGTGVVTAVGSAVNTTGGLVTQSGTLAANNVLLGGGASTAITSSSLLATSAAVTTGNYIKAIGYADTVTALGNTGTAINIDITSGGVFSATLTGNCTFTLRYPVSSGASSFTLILTNDGTAGRTVAWAGGSFLFPGGAASLSRTTTANAVDVWFFFTPNGGTTYYGSIPMKNLAA